MGVTRIVVVTNRTPAVLREIHSVDCTASGKGGQAPHAAHSVTRDTRRGLRHQDPHRYPVDQGGHRRGNSRPRRRQRIVAGAGPIR
jgi:hypothetical protein